MKASFLRKIWILIQTIASTLVISIYALYMQATNTYDRKFSDRVLRWWANILLKATGASWDISNPHGVDIKPGTPCIIMSNHRSHYDIPLIFTSLPGSIRMLTKKELFKIPVWGRAMKSVEFISIDRHDHGQALKDLEIAKEKMKSGIVLWIAPEGTRSRSGSLGEFKKGGFMVAIQTGATIIPVGITGSEKIHRPNTRNLHLNQHVKVRIGKPIDASAYTEESKDQLMIEVREEITSLIGE